MEFFFRHGGVQHAGKKPKVDKKQSVKCDSDLLLHGGTQHAFETPKGDNKKKVSVALRGKNYKNMHVRVTGVGHDKSGNRQEHEKHFLQGA